MLVLTVDQKPDVHYYLREIIISSGHDCVNALSGQQALQLFLQRQPDVIIADRDLGDMEGLDLLENIRRVDSGTIFILMINDPAPLMVGRALELRANNYIPKPPRFEAVVSLMDKYAAVVKTRELREEVVHSVISREIVIEIGNRLDLVAEVASFLVGEAGDAILPDQRSGIHLGLYELLINAIEHGNLGISYLEKHRCLRESPYRLNELVQRRSSEANRARRRVTIEFRVDPGRCEWIIQDEGEGFDWTSVPDPFANNEEALNGRGIYLASYQFDEVTYLGNGNRVRLIKRRVSA